MIPIRHVCANDFREMEETIAVANLQTAGVWDHRGGQRSVNVSGASGEPGWPFSGRGQQRYSVLSRSTAVDCLARVWP